MKKAKELSISIDLRMDIFCHTFLELIEHPSYRDMFRDMIEMRESVDLTEVNLLLTNLEIELKQGGKHGLFEGFDQETDP